MNEVTSVGLDTAKHVFQVHGANAQSRMVLSKKVSRAKLLLFRVNGSLPNRSGSMRWCASLEARVDPNAA